MRGRSVPWWVLAMVTLGLLPACRSRDRSAPTASGSVVPSGSPSAATPRAPPSAEPREPSAAADQLVVVMGGDVNLGRTVGKHILRGDQPRPFAALASILSAADLVFVNLESQLSDQHGETQSSWSQLVFTGPPGGADLLAEAGIRAVSVANNHIWDYGKKAFFETLTHLERAGVAYVGAARVPDRMFEPVVLHIKGFTVALFAVTEIWNQGELRGHAGEHHVAWADYDRLEPRLREIRPAADLVLLSYHGGGEYMETPLPATQDLAHRIMQTGVDAFVGHHPHVTQGIGWHDGRPIFFSLGNLVFRMHRDFPWTGMSFLARLTFRRGSPTRVEACPFRILGDDPLLLDEPGREVRERMIRRHLARVSYVVGGTQVGEPGEHSCMLLSPAAQ